MMLAPRFWIGAFNFTVVTIVLVYAGYRILSLDPGFLVITAIIVGIFQIIPSLYFVISYYKINKHLKIEIHSNKMIAHQNDDYKVVYLDCIDRVVIYKSAANPFDSYPLSVVDYFSYAQIILKNNTEIVITSLFADNIEDALKPLGIATREVNNGMPLLNRRDKYPDIFD